MQKLAIIALPLWLTACTVSGPDPIMAFGMPNPASVYCIERGGSLDIHQSPAGDKTDCILSDGTRVDEWEFYRRNHPQR